MQFIILIHKTNNVEICTSRYKISEWSRFCWYVSKEEKALQKQDELSRLRECAKYEVIVEIELEVSHHKFQDVQRISLGRVFSRQWK